MQIPRITADGDPYSAINAEIEKDVKDRFNVLKGQMVGNVDNKYKYSVTYENYENIVNGKKILSLRVTEKMQDSGNKKVTYLEVKTYNIYVNQKVKADNKVAFDMLGKEYKTILLNNIKSHVVEKGYVKAEDFKYDVTDLEIWYIKDGNMHIVFNPGKIAEDKFGIIDVEISNKG